MKLPQYKSIKWNYLALSFALPCAGMLLLMIFARVTPFGTNSMLYSDAWHQYFPFFKAYREALLSGDSLLYSWNVGMGMDYLGLISYYLASPLNLLSVLVPESFVLPYFSLLAPVRLGLAGLFFAIFLKKMFGRDDLSLPLFGGFYATCAWAMGYQWNVMWVDTFAMLPLMALGTIYLLRDKKFVLYTVILFLSVFTNYYVGFFTCIFVLLLFICYQICRCKSVGRFFADLGRIACFTILAIGMTAILELPALAALMTTQSSVNSYPNNFSVNIVTGEAVTAARNAWNAFKTAKIEGEGDLFGLFFTALWKSIPPMLDGMGQVAGNMSGGLTPSFKEGLPNLYCGVGTIVFAFLFLTCKQVKLRDKICSVALLVFFMLSFIIRQLDYIWHGFHFTNQIPYRFSFLYSFVVLYMAYRAYLLRRRFEIWQILVAGGLTIFVVSLSAGSVNITDALASLGSFLGAVGGVVAAIFSPDPEAMGSAVSALNAITRTHGDAYIFLLFNLIFLILYIGVLITACWDKPLPLGGKKSELRQYIADRSARRASAASLLAVAMVAEIALNIVNFGVNFSFVGVSNYPYGTEYTASMIRYMKERESDNLFYRAEMTHARPLNEAALNSYNGISTFTSSANVKVTEFMKRLGYGAKNTYNRYCFEESSPVANLFLNLKYMIERDAQVEENSYFDTVHHYDNVYLLENNAYLPLGFLAESKLGDVKFNSAASDFRFQNDLFTAATGISQTVWYTNTGRTLEISGENVKITSKSTNGKSSYVCDKAGANIYYTFTVEKEGFLCLDIDMSARNSYTVYKNDNYLFSESISLPQTIAVSDVVPGDVIEVKVACTSGKNGSIDIETGILKEDVFRSGYEILAASPLELTEFSNTYVEGTVDCNRDGLLYTSIPQDGNWSVSVDGKETEAVLVGDAMIAVPLTQGQHTVAFCYENDAFSLGWKISLVCLLAFGAAVYLFYFYPHHQRKGKFEKSKK